jgi:hypothetical protein
MSAALRVLGLTLVGWAGVRAAALGMLPGAEMFTLAGAPAPAAAIQPTQFPPLEAPVAYDDAGWAAGPIPAGYSQYPAIAGAPRPFRVPVYYAVPTARAYQTPPRSDLLHVPRSSFQSAALDLNDWPLSRFAAPPLPTAQSTVIAPGQSNPAFIRKGIDRLQLTAWSLLRGRQGVTIAPGSLAPAGTLGGSQAGARLTYNFTPDLAASLRTSTPVGGTVSGGEIAAGVKFTPVRGLPLSLTAERRKAVGRYGGGRDAFALFVEGGVYQQPLWGMQLDGYGQAGMVGIRSRDWFADGAFFLTRPLFRQFSGGVAMWGGVQPGLYRIDAGPRLTMRVRNNIRVHVDWRQRVAGNALPRSGPSLTLAGDF